MQAKQKENAAKPKVSKKAPIYELEVQSYNKEIKGFKILKAEKPEQEIAPFVKAKYPTLSTEQRGWNAPSNIPYVPIGKFEEVLSSI